MYLYESDGRASSCIPEGVRDRLHIVTGIFTPIIIPFHVSDGTRVEDSGHRVDNEVLDFGQSNVEDELVSSQGSGVLAGM